MYSKFTIRNFRSYQGEQTLRFAIPKAGLPGSGITYVVGENNAGKTTLVEGIRINGDTPLRSSEIRGIGPVLQIFRYSEEKEVVAQKVSLLRENSNQVSVDPKINNDERFEIIPSRRHWNHLVFNEYTDSTFSAQTTNVKLRSQDIDQMTSSALESIEKDSDRYVEFIKLVKRVITNFSSFTIGFEDQKFVEYLTNDGKKHRSDFLGDGVISILRILLQIFANTNRPLIIDEPELSLHPLAQKRLLKIIAEYACNRQIIVSTHSPYFIDWTYIKNGAAVNKVAKNDDQVSEIHCLKPYHEYRKLVDSANWQQPFLMDIVSKEIFFHDNILFVEGQEDVGLLQSDGQLSDCINIFGYGVRGKDSFTLALALARDLGIKKASAILDGGESESSIKTSLGSGPVDQSQKMTVAARAMAEKKAVGHLS